MLSLLNTFTGWERRNGDVHGVAARQTNIKYAISILWSLYLCGCLGLQRRAQQTYKELSAKDRLLQQQNAVREGIQHKRDCGGGSSGSAAPLRPGWREVKDAKTGTTYYWNKVSALLRHHRLCVVQQIYGGHVIASFSWAFFHLTISCRGFASRGLFCSVSCYFCTFTAMAKVASAEEFTLQQSINQSLAVLQLSTVSCMCHHYCLHE